ncbi:MAG: hypothetical protein ABSH35_07080 [Isosphaeraceae bacterium]|jgi:hypothetical protein
MRIAATEEERQEAIREHRDRLRALERLAESMQGLGKATSLTT